MTKRKGLQRTSEQSDEGQSTGFEWVPLWGWLLIFLLPLVASEVMFWNVGRTFSMVIFPIAWIGFWIAMMERSGWPVLKSRKRDEDSASEEDG